jgi:hypothetical protein
MARQKSGIKTAGQLAVEVRILAGTVKRQSYLEQTVTKAMTCYIDTSGVVSDLSSHTDLPLVIFPISPFDNRKPLISIERTYVCDRFVPNFDSPPRSMTNHSTKARL